jgi:hypothetical protein
LFSGGSVIASLQKLASASIAAAQLIPGIQVGEAGIVEAMGVPVHAAVKYTARGGSNIFDKVDLGDPRDYLVGASGLVVQLPSGKLGRSPYILPFVSPAARAGIHTGEEIVFSERVLEANQAFYQEIEAATGTPVLLGHTDPAFVKFMADIFGFAENMPMTQIIDWAMHEMDAAWHHVSSLGQQQIKSVGEKS